MSENEIGFIYLATNPSMPDLVKIGMTCGDVQSRMRELSSDTGVPSAFECAYFCEVENPAQVERQLHEQFAFCRESGNREFFRADWRMVRAALQMLQKAEGGVISDSDKTKMSKIGKHTLIKWVKERNAENVRHVLAVGGNPEQADENQKTALMWAADLEHAEIVKILLKADADPNKTPKGDGTALMFAAQRGDVSIAEILLDAGAYPDAALRKASWTALMSAAKFGHAKVVKVLLAAGANPNAASNVGWTALILAGQEGHAKVAKILLSAGANPNSNTAEHGETALMWAACSGHAEVAKILLLAVADLNVENNRGKTALDIAKKNEQSEVVRILEEAGAQVGRGISYDDNEYS